MSKDKSAKQIAEAIVKSGINATELAKMVKVNPSTISRILSGSHTDPRSSTMDAMRKLLAEREAVPKKTKRAANKYLGVSERI